MRAPGADAGARYWHERALSAPTRVVDNLHGISAPTRVVDTSARYIPLAVSTTPSRCQRPPHGADNARPYRQRALELAPGPTTRVHAQGGHPRHGRACCGHGRQRPLPGGTLARAGRAADAIDVDTTGHTHCPEGRPHQGRAQEDCSGSCATPSEYAHKDPDLRNKNRTQGLDSALVCGAVLSNSLPCVRHQGGTDAEAGRERTCGRSGGPAEKPTDQTRPYPFGDAPRGRRSQSMEPRRSEKSAVRRSFVGSSSMETSSPSELHRGTHQFG